MMGALPANRGYLTGYWPREAIVAMDRKALARMAHVHPDLCPAELRRNLAVTVFKQRATEARAEKSTKPVIPDHIVGSLLMAADDMACNREDWRVLARQITLFLLAKAYSAKDAAEAIGTIEEAVDSARRRIAPVVASTAMLAEPKPECAQSIFAASMNVLVSEKWECADLIETTCAVFEMGKQELLADSNSRSVTQPRQIAMWLCRRFTPAPLSEIGREFRKDHTTVMHGIRKVAGVVADKKINGGDDPRSWALMLKQVIS